MLDTDRLEWRKWNDNAGAIDGRTAHVPIDVDYELAKIIGKMEDLCVIAEGDSDGESDSDDEEAHDDTAQEHDDNTMRRTTTTPSDHLQRSRTLRIGSQTRRQVCDLQASGDTDAVPPKFELTDPAIHYASRRREMVFGRTDKGRKGIDLFFVTHKCTSVCKLMQLSKKNPDWRKKWHSGAWSQLSGGDKAYGS
jgi:hypothetical protein